MNPDLFFNLAMAAVDLSVVACLYRSRTAAAWWKAGLGAAGGAVCLVGFIGYGPGAALRLAPYGYHPFFIWRLVAYVILLHAPICLVAGAVLLCKTAPKTAALAALATLGALALAVDTLWIEPGWLDVTHVKIASAKLDRSVRVALLADLQTDVVGRYQRRVFERLRDEKPDLILLAGDYVQGADDRCEQVRKELNALMKELNLAAPLGVFAVQGNVERQRPWVVIFEGLPVIPVIATSSFDVGPLQLTCLGMYDSFNPNLRLGRDEPDRFHLVVGHAPNYALGHVDADLLLAGHTHGGQVRLPWIGALSSGCNVPRAWAAGLTPLPRGGRIYVSRGVGMECGSAPRVRLLCRPELTIIDLVPEEARRDLEAISEPLVHRKRGQAPSP
jgi:uncharacterized protein